MKLFKYCSIQAYHTEINYLSQTSPPGFAPVALSKPSTAPCIPDARKIVHAATGRPDWEVHGLKTPCPDTSSAWISLIHSLT